VGEKMTLIVQLAPAESEAGQVFFSAKLPLRAMVSGVRAALPVFVNVIVCAALCVETVCAAKVRLVAEKLATAPTPVPVRVAVSVAGTGLVYVTVNAPVRIPAAVGVNVTVIGQGLLVVKTVSLSQPVWIWKSPLTCIPGTSGTPLTLLAGLVSVIV